MSLRIWASIFIFLCLNCVVASAQVCTFSNTGIDFGNLTLTSGSFPNTTGTFTAKCAGTAGQTIRICPNFGNGSGGSIAAGFLRNMNQGNAQLAYTLFYNNNFGNVWGSYLWGQGQTPPAMSLVLDGSGNGSLSQTINALVFNGQGATPSGTFVSSFAGADSATDYGYASNFNCSSSLSNRAVSVPFVVRTTNNSTCSLSTTDLDFGTQADLASAKDATNSLYITCTMGTAYNVSMGNGTSGATSPTARRMTNAASKDSVGYGIYLDAGRSQPWGNGTTGGMASAIGNGAAQTFIGYGRIPAQASPAALNYADVVVVTITY